MRKTPRLLFVIADGGKARFLERNAETGAYVRLQELDGTDRIADLRQLVRDTPAVRGVQAATGARHMTGTEDPYRQVKADFAGEVAAEAVRTARSRDDDGLVLIAPPRILQALTRGVGDEIPVFQTLPRNLSNTPDWDLERWLAPLERSAVRSAREA